MKSSEAVESAMSIETSTFNLRRIVGAPVIFAASLFALAVCAEQVAPQIPDVPNWQLFWHDEFDGSSLKTTNWQALDRQNSQNNEKQYYRPEQVTVSNGDLQLTATNQPLANKHYRSGLITSKALFGPGRFESRIDLPSTQGMWPAFWLNPNKVPWPRGGEIDIVENKGSQPTITSSAFHWQKNSGPCCANWHFVTHNYTAKSKGNPVNFTTGFHTYAMECDKNAKTSANEVRFYVDGNLHFTVDENSSMSVANFTTPKNIILNLAVGGDFGGDPNDTTLFPQTMLVDYVRVWHRSNPSGVSGVYNGDGHFGSAEYLFATAAAFSIPEPTAGVPLGVSAMLLYAQPPWHD